MKKRVPRTGEAGRGEARGVCCFACNGRERKSSGGRARSGRERVRASCAFSAEVAERRGGLPPV